VGYLSSLLDDWGWGDVELAAQFIKRDTIFLLGDYLFLDRSKWYYPTSSRPVCPGLLRLSAWYVLANNP